MINNTKSLNTRSRESCEKISKLFEFKDPTKNHFKKNYGNDFYKNDNPQKRD